MLALLAAVRARAARALLATTMLTTASTTAATATVPAAALTTRIAGRCASRVGLGARRTSPGSAEIHAVRIVRRLAGARSRRMTTATLASASGVATATTAHAATTMSAAAAMFGTPTRILMRLVFAGLRAFGARCMGSLGDLELGCRRELHRTLEHPLDVPEQRDLIRRDQRHR